jgi:ribonucleoside-diphosphate reductase alpha chain
MSTTREAQDLFQRTLRYFGGDELRARVFFDKYALRDPEGRVVEATPPEMWARVAREIASVEPTEAKRREWEEKFRWLLEDFRFVPGGRILFGAGNPRRATLLNCYVIPIRGDSLEDIFGWCKQAARTYSFGGGVGTDISVLRPRGTPVNNAAITSSGAVSFMELLSTTTGTIGQAGRRGALMITIASDHPDVLEFTRVKRNLDKVRYANISVRVDDAFMRAVERHGEYTLRFANEKVRVERTVRARELWDELVRGARDYAEPGVIFWDTVRRWSTSEYNGMNVITTNPCSLVGSTYVFTPSGIHRLDTLVRNAVLDRTAPTVLIDRRAADAKGLDAVRADALAFTGVKRIWRVETTSGFVLRGTGDHKVKVLNDDRYDPLHGSKGWKRIDELKPGDVLAVVDPNDPTLVERMFAERSPYLHVDEREIQPRGQDAHDRRIHVPEVWDEDLAYLLGYAVGEGGYTRPTRKSRLGRRLDLHMDREDAPYVKAIVERVVGRCLRYRRVRVGAGGPEELVPVELPLQTREGTARARVSVHSAAFLRLLGALGLRPAVAHEKAVPESVLVAPRDATAAFLRGLFDADGTVSRPGERPRVSLSSTSRRLMEQVQLLLLQFGILSSVSTHTAQAKNASRRSGPEYVTKAGEGREDRSAHDSYRLCITSYPSIERFARYIGSALPRKQRALEELLARRPWPPRQVTDRTVVKAVVQEDVWEPVYDLTVLDTKSFIANGLVVSNSEIPLEPYGACCLGNVNLSAFVREAFTERAHLDWETLERALRYAVRFLDDVLDYNADKHPLPEQREASLRSRRIGVGFTGMGDMLAKLRLRYDSEEAIAFVDRTFERIKNVVYEESAHLAAEKGTFPAYDRDQHFQGRFLQTLDPAVRDKAYTLGLRHVALLTVPPVGSGAALAGTTSGIEPIFDLYYLRRSESLSQAQFKVYHPLVRQYMDEFGVDEEHLPDYFVTAHRIAPEMRVRMQATVQKHIDHSISSTVNLPESATVEDVERIYFLAWKLGCKGITVYREGSREGVLITEAKAQQQTQPEAVRVPAEPARDRAVTRPRPKVTQGRTERIETPRGRVYVTVNEDEYGPCEVFVESLDVEAEATGRLASLCLRSGVDPREVIEQLWRVQSREVALDRSADGTVVRVSTIAQAVALALGRALYGDGFRPDREFPRAAALPEPTPRARQERLRFVEPQPQPAAQAAAPQTNGAAALPFAGVCPDCGDLLVHENGCAHCRSCGYSRC